MTIEEALKLYPENPNGLYGAASWVEDGDVALVLADEVRRLRAELQGANAELEETKATVEAMREARR